MVKEGRFVNGNDTFGYCVHSPSLGCISEPNFLPLMTPFQSTEHWAAPWMLSALFPVLSYLGAYQLDLASVECDCAANEKVPPSGCSTVPNHGKKR